MKISFYYVDKECIQYLKDKEIAKRGFTTIPNMEYHAHDKFVYGIVMSIHNVDYYVPFSHYDKQQEDNILIKVDYKSCLHLLSQIQKHALRTYQRVVSGKDEELTNNSCLFLLLEDACKEYIDTHCLDNK